jgi:transposase
VFRLRSSKSLVLPRDHAVIARESSGYRLVLRMLLRPETLPRDPDLLIAMVVAQAVEIEKLQTALKTMKALIFGPRSEKLAAVLDAQLVLELDDLRADVTRMAANDDDTPSAILLPCARKKARRNIGQLPRHLLRVEEVIEPTTTICPCCAGTLHKIGEDVAEALDAVPAVLRVLRTVRPRYACRSCGDAVVQAPAKPRLLDGGMATTALMANVAVWKFAWHMPLNRQVQMLAGQGVSLDRSTLAKWIKRMAWWLSGLYRRQIEVIHSYPRLFCDETRMPVRRPGQTRTHTGQFWTHAVDDRPWCGPAPPAVAYIYAEGRGHHEIKEQLAQYQGLLQVDGYAGYKRLTKPCRSPGPIRLAHCLAHARRKFIDIYKATQSTFAQEVIERLAEVYAIEARIRGTDAAHRRSVRQARTAFLMVELKGRLDSTLAMISTQSSLAKAIRYSLGHWAGLTLFLEDGRLEVDSNTVERSMRPIALGRRNSLFAGDDGGAESWAILASLLQTAKLNEVDPYTWLNDTLERIVSGTVKSHELDQLLAWDWKAGRDGTNLPLAA